MDAGNSGSSVLEKWKERDNCSVQTALIRGGIIQ